MRLGFAAIVAAIVATSPASTTTPLRWDDLPAVVQQQLAAHGVDRSGFLAELARINEETAIRLRDGAWEALIYYALQSRQFTSLPPLEPALSAKAHHDEGAVPDDARARLEALAELLETPPPKRKRGQRSVSPIDDEKTSAVPVSARLADFRRLVADDPRVAEDDIPGRLATEYGRVMRFLHEKEFPDTQTDVDVARGVAPAIYHDRGHSTDTAIEAGYAVRQALGVIQALSPARPLQRILVIGPGLTLAPRTGFIDEVPPQSYQPYAVLDDVVSLGLTTLSEARVDCIDINPRVISHLEARRTSERTPALLLVSQMPDRASAPLTPDYRRYFEAWGNAVGDAVAPPTLPGRLARHLRRAIMLSPAARARVHATRANIVTERVTALPHDLIVATNVLTYVDDVQLSLALANIARMLAPDGYFVHNETRDALVDIADPVGLPIAHTRTVVFTTPSSDEAPLYDRIWLHRAARPGTKVSRSNDQRALASSDGRRGATTRRLNHEGHEGGTKLTKKNICKNTPCSS